MPLYCVDKPLGLSSHDVVARARRRLGTRRVGHAGTLDPLATGVLLLLTQEATKLSQFVTGHDKSYLAWVTFGLGTPTLDAEGPVTSTADASGLDRERLAAALPAFLALREQRPPAFSAIKQAGVRSYAAARRGEVVEPPARPAAYRSLRLLAFAEEFAALPERFSPGTEPGAWSPDANGRSFELPARLDGSEATPEGAAATATSALSPAPSASPTALFALRVAAGTYIRSFARDLGLALGLPAHLAGLVRTASGSLDLAAATPLEELEDAPEISLRAALDLAELSVDEPTAAAIVQGQRPRLDISVRTAVIGPAGELVAVLDPDAERGFRVARVFARGT